MTLASTRASVVTPEIGLARLTLHNAVDEQARRRSTMVVEARPSLPAKVVEDAMATENNADSAIDLTVSPEQTPMQDIVMDEAAPPMADASIPATVHEIPEANSSTTTNATGQISSTMLQDDSKPPPIPPRPRGNSSSPTSKVEEKQQVEKWAQQQDVREVMANVLVQLRWAIRGNAVTEKGDQIDRISK